MTGASAHAVAAEYPQILAVAMQGGAALYETYVAAQQNLDMYTKLAQKSFASPGKNWYPSKTEDTNIILYVWPCALEF